MPDVALSPAEVRRDRLAALERDYDTLERALELAQARNLAPRTGEWGALADDLWSCLSVLATERAALLGGTLRLESHPGSGARLLIEVPLRPEDNA